ncbi:HAUS augmin-like complex subunit 8 isoform X1 [Ornithorhynchus anatinus]|uniref:HAUS augmin-like complex subunit 8 isoform X1 n=1 Tax=Ornithorhynchus anatinus TaxID=9258 RepID=UPI0010A85C47|nr:HAUS augmin-like complex subunit 8 isoform X1 [Ornithorhynchus anatinus]
MKEDGGFAMEDGPSIPDNPKTQAKKTQGRLVKSRYMQYEKKAVGKTSVADQSTNCSGKSFSNAKIPTRKCKTTSGVPTLSESTTKNNLQSTLLEGHSIAHPDLDLSAINDKSLFRGKVPDVKHINTSKPLQTDQNVGPKTLKKEQTSTPEDIIRMIESQTLLLNFLSLKMEKNLTRLEEKAEKNLLIICEEKDKFQQKVYEMKRRLQLRQRDQQLAEIVTKQNEVLAPSVAKSECFKEEYKTFATALDSTRHELPVKQIHMEGNRHKFLDDLQHQLIVSRSLLSEVTNEHSEGNCKAFDAMCDLQKVVLKKDTELKRTFAEVLELSSEVSKEASLNNQEVWEDTQESEILSQWYFSRP